MSSVERRRAKRVIFEQEMLYRDRNKKEQGFKNGRIKDISEYGALIELYELFPPHTFLEIRFELSPDGLGRGESYHTMIGEVVRIGERKSWLYRIGVAFCKMDETTRNVIRELVRKGRFQKAGCSSYTLCAKDTG